MTTKVQYGFIEPMPHNQPNITWMKIIVFCFIPGGPIANKSSLDWVLWLGAEEMTVHCLEQ